MQSFVRSESVDLDVCSVFDILLIMQKKKNHRKFISFHSRNKKIVFIVLMFIPVRSFFFRAILTVKWIFLFAYSHQIPLQLLFFLFLSAS